MRAGLLTCFLAVATLAVGQNLVVSTSGSCADVADETCLGSRWGDCCSQVGFCGNNVTYCGSGCQSGFGACYDHADQISEDGGCGSNGKICLGSIFGNCCSSKGFCGSTDTYCGTGCQDAYGACGNSASNVTATLTTAAAARPSTTIDTSSAKSSTISTISTPTGAVSTTTLTAAVSSVSASAATATGTQSQSVTSTAGFVAGMTIMALALVAIIGALAWFFFVRRPRQRQNKDNGPPVYQEAPYKAPIEAPGPVIYEKAGTDVSVHEKPSTGSSQSELGGFPVSELPAHVPAGTDTALVDERAAAGYEGAYRGH